MLTLRIMLKFRWGVYLVIFVELFLCGFDVRFVDDFYYFLLTDALMWEIIVLLVLIGLVLNELCFVGHVLLTVIVFDMV